MNKIKWNKQIINNIPYFIGIEKEIENIFEESFLKQTSIDGKKFPTKKDKKNGRLYLKNTGEMVESLEAKTSNNVIVINLKNKSKIYEKFLHNKTQWLSLSNELGKLLLSLIKLNLKSKGYQ